MKIAEKADSKSELSLVSMAKDNQNHDIFEAVSPMIAFRKIFEK